MGKMHTLLLANLVLGSLSQSRRFRESTGCSNIDEFAHSIKKSRLPLTPDEELELTRLHGREKRVYLKALKEKYPNNE